MGEPAGVLAEASYTIPAGDSAWAPMGICGRCGSRKPGRPGAPASICCGSADAQGAEGGEEDSCSAARAPQTGTLTDLLGDPVSIPEVGQLPVISSALRAMDRHSGQSLSQYRYSPAERQALLELECALHLAKTCWWYSRERPPIIHSADKTEFDLRRRCKMLSGFRLPSTRSRPPCAPSPGGSKQCCSAIGEGGASPRPHDGRHRGRHCVAVRSTSILLLGNRPVLRQVLCQYIAHDGKHWTGDAAAACPTHPTRSNCLRFYSLAVSIELPAFSG